jgi:tetratricopeptide (TPR) repeat protein
MAAHRCGECIMTSTTEYQYDIFLSHNHYDEKWVAQLAARLEEEDCNGQKLKVFFSPWDIRPGYSIPKEIEKAIPVSRKVGLIMSPEAMASAWVEVERLVITYINVSERQERLIPLYLRDCEIPALLKPILPIDFRDASRFEEGYKKLLAVLKDEPLPRGSRTSEPEPLLVASAIPRPPVIGFVARHDKNDRDILALLREELDPQKSQVISLWGWGGVGKTTIAAMAARQLVEVFAQRIVWVSAEGRADFSLSTLLDEIATSLGHADSRKLILEFKKEAVRAIVATAPTLVILDDFETISPDEQVACANYLLQQASCPVLITTRQRINGARNISIEPMSLIEAREFLDKFITQQTHDQAAFKGLDKDHIIEAAERNPLVLQWVIAQIDLAQDPQDVLEELSQGEGTAAQRVFNRSFNLPQVGNRSRDALLALSLFAPSASRDALAHVAGLGKDIRRLNKVVQPLASLWLVKATEGSQRLRVEGLTRDLTRAHLFKDKRIDEFRKRFITFFVLYAEEHSSFSPKDFDALEPEKDNMFSTVDMAFEKKDWKRVIRIMGPIFNMLRTRGYWDEALLRSKQALQAARYSMTESNIAFFAQRLALIYQDRGDYTDSQQLYSESLEINKRLGHQSEVALILNNLAIIAHARGEYIESRCLHNESLDIKKTLNAQKGIADTLHNLAAIAQDQGEYTEARRLLNESLLIKKKLNDESGIADTLSGLGLLMEQQGEIEEAQSLYNESIGICKRLGDQRGIARVLRRLGHLAQDQGKIEKAQGLYNESIGICKRLGDQRGTARTLHSLGYLAQGQGKIEEARRLYNESLEINRKLGHISGVATCLHHLGLVAQDQIEYAEARRLYNEGLEISKKLEESRGIAGSLHQLGTLSLIERDFEEAESVLNQSLVILKKLEAKQEIAECTESLGKLRAAQNALSEAERLFAESLQMAKDLSDQFRIASVKQSLGLLRQNQGNNAEARRLLTEALEIFDKLGSPEASKTRQSLKQLEDEPKDH